MLRNVGCEVDDEGGGWDTGENTIFRGAEPSYTGSASLDARHVGPMLIDASECSKQCIKEVGVET